MARFKFIKKFPRSHKFFEDTEHGGTVAIADYSGGTPDKTDDGVLWIDHTRPIVLDNGRWLLPLVGEERDSHTFSDPDACFWIAERLAMQIQVKGSDSRYFIEASQIPPRGDSRFDKIREMTSRDWQIFTSVPGHQQVAKELSERLASRVEKGMGQLGKAPYPTPLAVAMDIANEFYYGKGAIMDRFIAWGATDTEPRGVLLDILEEAFGLESCSLPV